MPSTTSQLFKRFSSHNYSALILHDFHNWFITLAINKVSISGDYSQCKSKHIWFVSCRHHGKRACICGRSGSICQSYAMLRCNGGCFLEEELTLSDLKSSVFYSASTTLSLWIQLCYTMNTMK
jgi:hypothetical protein